MSIAFETEIMESLKTAMKAKDQIRMETLRAMKSALKYKHVEKNQGDVSSEEAVAVFQTMLKQRKEAFEQFSQNNRPELAEKEKREMEIISEFMPKQMNETELKVIVQEAIKTSGATSQKDLGKVMKDLKAKTAGRADMKLVTDLIKAALPAA